MNFDEPISRNNPKVSDKQIEYFYNNFHLMSFTAMAKEAGVCKEAIKKRLIAYILKKGIKRSEEDARNLIRKNRGFQCKKSPS